VQEQGEEEKKARPVESGGRQGRSVEAKSKQFKERAKGVEEGEEGRVDEGAQTKDDEKNRQGRGT